MEKVHLRMTMPQAKKLMKGGTIQLSPNALRENAHYLILERKTANKVRRAQKAGKGCRVCLSQQEMHHSGEGIADFFKNAVNWVNDNVIKSDFYQKNLRPIAKQLVNTGIDNFVPSPGRDIARKVADFGSEQTGAYGFRDEFAKLGKSANDFYQKHAKKYVAPHLRKAVQSAERSLVSRAKKLAPQYATDIDRLHDEYGERAITEFGNRTNAFGLRKGRGLSDNYSNFLSPNHPAMRPQMPNLPPMGGWIYMYPINQEPTNKGNLAISGGSFKVAGSGKKRVFKPRGGSFMPSG